MNAATRFLFERRFDPEEDCPAPVPSEVAEPAPFSDPQPEVQDPAIYTQEDLDRVRAEALSFGRRQGAAETAGATDQRIARALEQIAGGINPALTAREQADAENVKHVTAIALAVIRKLFPEMSRRHGLTEITGLIDAIIGRVIDKPKLTVRVSGSIKPNLAERLDGFAEAHGFGGQIIIQEDSGLAEGDCHVSWAGGGAAREGAAIWRDIDAVICRTLGPLGISGGASEGKAVARHTDDGAKHHASAQAPSPSDHPA